MTRPFKLLRNNSTHSIVGIVGHARSGKDTVAQRLVAEWGYTRFAFADPLRYFCDLLHNVEGPEPFTEEWVEDWEERKRAEPDRVRLMLQDVGMAARKGIFADVWVFALQTHITSHPDIHRWVIPDVRQLNEAWLINSLPHGQTWGIKRPGVGSINGHVAESAIDDILERVEDANLPVLHNNASIEELHEQVDAYASWHLGE